MTAYLLLKSLHLASTMAFIGGLAMLALVTIGWVAVGGALLPHEQRIGRMALHWDRRVTAPAMAATWALGLGLASWGGWLGAGWLHAKLMGALLLSALHGVLSAKLRQRLEGSGPGDASAWIRLSPVIVMLIAAAIACLAVLKP